MKPAIQGMLVVSCLILIQPAPSGGADPSGSTVLQVTARVDGYTQGTMFNLQKYPFKYAGSSGLDAVQVKALAKAGDVPADVARTLLGCLLWPGQQDVLEKAVLQSDGNKLKGEAQVLHRYGKQGTHVLKFPLEGTVDANGLTLQALQPTVSGVWDWGGGTITLKGEVKVQFEVRRP
jgi:hypothetical protein